MRGTTEIATHDKLLARKVREQIRDPENVRYLRSMPTFAVDEVPGELWRLLEKLDDAEKRHRSSNLE